MWSSPKLPSSMALPFGAPEPLEPKGCRRCSVAGLSSLLASVGDPRVQVAVFLSSAGGKPQDVLGAGKEPAGPLAAGRAELGAPAG